MPTELLSSNEERRSLIGRVADSALFLKSPRLREFLLYVGECTLNDHTDGAREQSIAEHVFNRKPDYATQDSIVRAEARNLRKRLEAYFATDGKDESTVIEMPRGQYLLTFRPRNVAPGIKMTVVPSGDPLSESVAVTASDMTRATPDTVTGVTPLVPSRERESRVYRWLCVILAVAGVASTFMAIRFYEAGVELRKQIPPVARSLPFSAIFGVNSLDTLIVSSDITLVPFFSSGRERMGLNDYITRSYPLISRLLPPDLVRKVVYTDGQEMTIAGDIVRTNAQAARHVFLRSGHQIQLSDLKDHNVILLGSSYSNPWGQMFEDKLSFRLELGGSNPGRTAHPQHHDEQSAYPCDANIVVRNLSPRAGEPAVYPCYANNRSFAVISFIPAENSMGNVLWIAGTTAESTAAAGELVVDERQTRQALKNAGIDPEGQPHFFEFLLKVTSFVGGATQAEVVAARVRPAQKP